MDEFLSWLHRNWHEIWSAKKPIAVLLSLSVVITWKVLSFAYERQISTLQTEVDGLKSRSGQFQRQVDELLSEKLAGAVSGPSDSTASSKQSWRLTWQQIEYLGRVVERHHCAPLHLIMNYIRNDHESSALQGDFYLLSRTTGGNVFYTQDERYLGNPPLSGIRIRARPKHAALADELHQALTVMGFKCELEYQVIDSEEDLSEFVTEPVLGDRCLITIKIGTRA